MSEFSILKNKILSITGEGNFINLAVAKQKAGITMITTVADAEKVLNILTKKRKVTPPVPAHVRDRYTEAHRLYVQRTTPEAYKDHGCPEVQFPKVGTSNGLTTYIVNFLTWTGHFANRTGNEGRVIMKEGKATRIHSSSKKGMQDIDSNLKHPRHEFGIPWKIEIKVGADYLKDKQIEYGKLVSSTGAIYSVVRDPVDFLSQLDKLLLP